MSLPALGESVTEGTVTRWLKQRRRRGRGRRAAARDLDRQGRHRDPVAVRRHAAGDPGRRRTRPSRSAPCSPSSVMRARRRPPAPQPRRPPPSPAAAEPAARAAARAGRRPGARARAGSRRRPLRPCPGRRPRLSRPRRSRRPAAARRRTRYVTPLVRKLAAEQRRRPGDRHRHRRRRPHPQGGRPRRRGARPPRPQPPPHRRRPQPGRGRAGGRRAVAAARHAPRRSPACARSSPTPHGRVAAGLGAADARSIEVDVTEVARLRAKAKDDFAEREGVKLTFLPFFAMAAVEALKSYPKINAAVDSRPARSPTRPARTSASRSTPSAACSSR